MNYTDNGTVTDNDTGLVWQKEDSGTGCSWAQTKGQKSRMPAHDAEKAGAVAQPPIARPRSKRLCGVTTRCWKVAAVMG